MMLAVSLILAAALVNANDAPQWNVDYTKSRMTFTAEQAGAAFEGTFRKFTADVRFAGDALATSHARVTVETASVDSQNEERDGYLRGAGWFESDAFPNVVWESRSFESIGENRYRALGKMTVRDETFDVPVEFSVKEQGNEVTLDGTAKLDRLALGLGLGDWANTEWIGKDVLLEVRLVARLDTSPP
jgi:polyisoprenoid-binding protein YceI